MPPKGMVEKIVFEPSTVPRGWLLLFYCLTATSSSVAVSQAPDSATFKTRLRWNTWMALDDGSLFLEPSEVNIQALFALAIHGDSFATPSLSWILVSHASRMTQAINLHLPGKEQRRILLFWSLYAVDKGVSLAFGRPPMLPSPYYQNVPLPDLGDGLAEYAPHIDHQNKEQTHAGSFGATHFLQAILLSILTGKLLHFLNCVISLDSATVIRKQAALHNELNQWYQTAMIVSRCNSLLTQMLILSRN
jgi:hypothetical protein